MGGVLGVLRGCRVCRLLAGALHLFAEGVELLLLQLRHHAVQGVDLWGGGERREGGEAKGGADSAAGPPQPRVRSPLPAAAASAPSGPISAWPFPGEPLAPGASAAPSAPPRSAPWLGQGRDGVGGVLSPQGSPLPFLPLVAALSPLPGGCSSTPAPGPVAPPQPGAPQEGPTASLSPVGVPCTPADPSAVSVPHAPLQPPTPQPHNPPKSSSPLTPQLL